MKPLILGSLRCLLGLWYCGVSARSFLHSSRHGPLVRLLIGKRNCFVDTCTTKEEICYLKYALEILQGISVTRFTSFGTYVQMMICSCSYFCPKGTSKLKS